MTKEQLNRIASAPYKPMMYIGNTKIFEYSLPSLEVNNITHIKSCTTLQKISINGGDFYYKRGDRYIKEDGTILKMMLFESVVEDIINTIQ